jgi:hypothetical protein
VWAAGRGDARIMGIQASNRTLTKQINDRDDCAKLANQYAARARKAIQGYFGPDSTQYAQAGGTRQSDRRTSPRRAKLVEPPKAD